MPIGIFFCFPSDGIEFAARRRKGARNAAETPLAVTRKFRRESERVADAEVEGVITAVVTKKSAREKPQLREDESQPRLSFLVAPEKERRFPKRPVRHARRLGNRRSQCTLLV
jgi:hypothetical protein